MCYCEFSEIFQYESLSVFSIPNISLNNCLNTLYVDMAHLYLQMLIIMACAKTGEILFEFFLCIRTILVERNCWMTFLLLLSSFLAQFDT